MAQRQTRDFLIRNMPLKVHSLLEKAAKDHHRSKTQEAIVALTNGLSMYGHKVKKPVPFKWNKKVSSKFIEDSIKEDQE